MTYKLGIDFGTTNTSVAIALPGKKDQVKPNVLLLESQSLWGAPQFVRSVFYIDAKGGIHVGNDADNQIAIDEHAGNLSAERYIRQIKMLLATGEMQLINVGNKQISPVALLTEMFRKLKEKADKFARDKSISLKGAVVGVPVSFSEESKNVYLQALINAGYYCNMEEAVKFTEFVSEPAAVAINYGEKLISNKRVMVFDFGGGTLDIAVVDLKEQIGKSDKLHPHKVIGQSTGYNIGGERINKEFFINFFVGEYGFQNIKSFLGITDFRVDTPEKLWDHMQNRNSGLAFIRQIDRCKCGLSKNDSVVFAPPDVLVSKKKLKEIVVTRDEFEEAVESVFVEVDQTIKDCLADCEKESVYPNAISEVLLAGGSSLIPKVRDILAKYFDYDIIGKNADNKLLPANEVMESIVRGLSIQGCKQNEVLEELLDCSYGVGEGSECVFSEIIPRGTPLSKVASDAFNDAAGMSRSYTTESQRAKTLVLKIMQRTYGINNQKDKVLKEIKISLDSLKGNDFDIYLSINKKTKMLVLKIKFANKKTFEHLSHSESNIKISL